MMVLRKVTSFTKLDKVIRGEMPHSFVFRNCSVRIGAANTVVQLPKVKTKASTSLIKQTQVGTLL